MYRAKRSWGHRLELFDERLRREAAGHLELERRLREALPRKELSLAYQPIFALGGGGEADSCEALLRWHPHDGEAVEPELLVARAQESGLIVQLGDWVLQTACAQASEWRKQGHELAVAVNASARGLSEVDLAARLRLALDRHGLPPQALWVEVTEQAILADPERACATLRRVHDAGVRLALDRAGSGESRLGLIGELPLDAIKLDREVMAAAAREDARGRALALALLEHARALGIRVVAVGVEDEPRLRLARELGCSHVQGFALGAPAAAEELSLRAACAVGSHERWGSLARLHHRR
jgi:EAL domain-containing protein (putative c-di-GMP-specific phosphodiesterase class I)